MRHTRELSVVARSGGQIVDTPAVIDAAEETNQSEVRIRIKVLLQQSVRATNGG